MDYYDMNLNHYKTFLVVAEYQSFSKAAEKLFVAQPAVTHSIKVLEERLNVKLFDRKSTGVVLTEEGRNLLYYIKTAMNNIILGEETISNIETLNAGNINIGVASHIPTTIILDCISSFNKLYPNVHFKISSFESTKLAEMYESKELDLLIDTPSLLNQKKENDSIDLFPIDNILIVGEKLKSILYETPVSVFSLKKHPLVLPAKNNFLRKLLEQINFTNEPFEAAIESNQLHTIVRFVKEGVGIGFVPKTIVEKDIKSQKLYEVYTEIIAPKTQVSIIFPATHLKRVTYEFINILKKQLKDINAYKEVNLIPSPVLNSISAKKFTELYKSLNKLVSLGKINIKSNLYKKDQLIKLAKSLYENKIAMCIEFCQGDFDETLLNITKYCDLIHLRVNLNDLNFDDNTIYFNKYDIRSFIQKYSNINFELSIDISSLKSSDIQKIKELIYIAKSLNLSLSFNETLSNTKSVYPLKLLENTIKKLHYFQISQGTVRRTFLNNNHNITIRRNFCEIAKLKGDITRYCKNYNILNVTTDGYLKYCHKSEYMLSIMSFVNSSDGNSILKKYIDDCCKNCPLLKK